LAVLEQRSRSTPQARFLPVAVAASLLAHVVFLTAVGRFRPQAVAVSAKVALEIIAHHGVRVFADHEGRARVVHEHGAQAAEHA